MRETLARVPNAEQKVVSTAGVHESLSHSMVRPRGSFLGSRLIGVAPRPVPVAQRGEPPSLVPVVRRRIV